MLTYLGMIGAAVCALGYALSNWNIYWLWLSSLGLFINWYGDSLDGKEALSAVSGAPAMIVSLIIGFFTIMLKFTLRRKDIK